MAERKFHKHFLALAAPSGGGKTSLCQMLLKKYSDTRLSISYTTRAPRGGEQEGREYFFVTKEKFKSLIQTQTLAEWAEVHGNFYGTGKDFLEKQAGENKVVVLDIDVQGVASLKHAYPAETLSVFIHPPSMEDLLSRLRARNTEPEEKIQQRMFNAKKEMARAHEFDYQIVNHSLEEAFVNLCKLVEREIGLR